MAGDSKESVKFHSQEVTRLGSTGEWAYPVRQVVSYATTAYVRQGFIVTDAEIVVIRVTNVPTGTSFAETREHRNTGHGHASRPSVGTTISDLFLG